MHIALVFFIKNLALLHSGLTSACKFKGTFNIATILSLPTAGIAYFSEWSLSNQSYIIGVLSCIAIDHLVGSAYHAFKIRDFTLKKNVNGLLSKLSLCAGAAILFEVIHQTVQEVSFIYDYLKIITRLIIILYPAGSAFMNMSALTNGVFPPVGWINKISIFNTSLDLEKLSHNGSTNTATDQVSAPEITERGANRL